MRTQTIALAYCGMLVWLSGQPFAKSHAADGELKFELRYQQPTNLSASRFHRLHRPESWQARQTALIICDMWDAHHCVNAVRREVELAPRVNEFAVKLREQGATVIHAPSSCMEAYANTAARERAAAIPLSKSMPVDIGSWCDRIPGEEASAYPVDQSDGGEDDDAIDHQLWAQSLEDRGLNPRAPWTKQISTIEIDQELDYISDSGKEIWSILDTRAIQNVILVGVHTNMCVLGRPFGLRRLAAGGKNVVLARDLTDTMYNPQAWPYVSHFSGTDLIVDHIERFVCPTISSDQLLGGEPFRFSGDHRPRLVMLIAESEYDTATSLTSFADRLLRDRYSVSYVLDSDTDRNQLIDTSAINSADALLVSARRRALPVADLKIVQDFVARGKPVIGIRTASHAFALRNQEPPVGHAVWPEFDARVFGGSYTNHHGNDLRASVALAQNLPFPFDVSTTQRIKPAGSLYKTSPLAPGALPALFGSVADAPPEPLAWVFIRPDGGRSFYTSLGHSGDFAQPAFEQLLLNGIHWACQLNADATLESITQRSQQYSASSGRQR
ncbi:MAG: ThuA domain-containing protein [Planctomycetales bacterium]|nr:ThuA domain-containing protein [Planctomycetales bacterium]